MGKKELKMQGTITRQTVITNILIEKRIFRWLISNYYKLIPGRLYCQTFIKLGVTYSYKLIKAKGSLHIAFHCKYSNAYGRYFLLHNNSIFDQVQAVELSDGLYVGSFPEHVLFNRESSYWKCGKIIIAFTFVADCSSSIQYNSAGEIGLQYDIDELSNDVKCMFIYSCSCDFIFRLDEGSMKAHRSVLYARSKFFEELFTLDEEAVELSITDTKLQTMRHVLMYVYGAELVDIRIENLVEVLKVAYLLNIPSLKEKCINYLEETDLWKAIEGVTFFECKIEKL